MNTLSARHTMLRSDRLAYVACLVAFTCLTIAILYGFNPYISQNAGSDFKTLYASAWCFSHGIDGYQFPNLAQVFRQNGVVEPGSWYGHSPVYPPFTLALLAPVCALPMVPAIYAWIIFSAACMALATAVLVHAASRIFKLNLPLKVLLVGMAAGSPLLEIGLELANVSVVSAALCAFAVAAPRTFSPWVRAVAITGALLLKPHIALWIVIAFFFSNAKQERLVLWRVCTLMAAFLVLFTVWGLVQHSVLLQFSGYRQIVLSELNSGSMSPGNHDVMEVFVQMTSLSALLGYWLWQHSFASILNAVCLLALGAGLAFACWKSRPQTEAQFIQSAAAWCAFGLMATYHRDADAMILMLVLPILLARLRENINDAWSWCVLALVVAGCFGPSADSLHAFIDPAPASSIFGFLLLRQASLAAACLTVFLVGHLVLRVRRLDR